MNNFKRWIIQNHDSLSLVTYQSKPPIDSTKWSIHDFKSKIKISNNEYEGIGISDDPEAALIKSIAEAIERSVALKFFDTSNGCAVGASQEKTMASAKYELVERHLFLSHFYENHPFCFISKIGYDVCEAVDDAIDWVLSKGAKVQFFATDKYDNTPCIVSVISDNGEANIRFGGVIGLCYSEKIEYSIEKSFLEALSIYKYYHSSNEIYNSLSIESFLSQQTWTFKDHGRLCLNVDYWRRIKHLFSENSEFVPRAVNINENKFVFREFDIGIEDCPLYFYNCSHVDLLNLTPGDNSNSKIGMPHPIC